jgi:hypothetical protein
MEMKNDEKILILSFQAEENSPEISRQKATDCTSIAVLNPCKREKWILKGLFKISLDSLSFFLFLYEVR